MNYLGTQLFCCIGFGRSRCLASSARRNPIGVGELTKPHQKLVRRTAVVFVVVADGLEDCARVPIAGLAASYPSRILHDRVRSRSDSRQTLLSIEELNGLN